MLTETHPYTIRNVQIKTAVWKGQPGVAKQPILGKHSLNSYVLSQTHKLKAEGS